MPDMSEYHETEDEMEGRCDSQRKAEKEGEFRISGVDYHDCPGAALGTCEPTDPRPDCPDCGGAGYVAVHHVVFGVA
jgi:hypothetical protein